MIAGEQDGFTPSWVTRRMCDQLPNAELHSLSGGTHTAPIEHPETIEVLVASFMARERLDRAVPVAASSPAPLLEAWRSRRRRR